MPLEWKLPLSVRAGALDYFLVDADGVIIARAAGATCHGQVHVRTEDSIRANFEHLAKLANAEK
jgi:hypothetical protein